MTLITADFSASAAGNTFAAVKKDLPLTGFGFRIMAPQTVQGTALYKYGCTDARTIVDTEFLNIKNDTIFHNIPNLQNTNCFYNYYRNICIIVNNQAVFYPICAVYYYNCY